VESIAAKKPGKLLDVGSGTGAFLDEMKRHAWEITGLEPDKDARNIAKNLYGLELNDISLLSGLPVSGFDLITLWHVLEHVHDLRDTMAQLFRLLATGGRIVIAVPNYTSFDAKKYRQYWAAYDVPRHLYHFSPQAMDRLVAKQGGRVLAYRPMWFDSFYVSLLSSKYKNGSTNWPGSVWTGLQSNMAALRDVKKCSSVIYIIAASSF
jgi:SAM-dependent methyltransferase